MSAPTSTFAPTAIAREALVMYPFGDTNTRMTNGVNHGTASNKRDAATAWLDYIDGGYSPKDADALLREDGPGLSLSPTEIATGAWTARRLLKLGYGRTDRTETHKITVPPTKLAEVIEILGLRVNVVYPSDAEPFEHGHVGRGVWATPSPDGSQVTVGLLPGDPHTDQIEALVA